jgi:hypothetical protein
VRESKVERGLGFRLVSERKLRLVGSHWICFTRSHDFPDSVGRENVFS